VVEPCKELPLSLCLLSFEYELSALDCLRDIIHRWSHRVQHLDLRIGCSDIRPPWTKCDKIPIARECDAGSRPRGGPQPSPSRCCLQ
jgi:hypothetical protein